MKPLFVAPPRDLAELRARAESIMGRSLAELAAQVARAAPHGGVHTKGKVGELLEVVLGANGGPGAVLDFPDLGVELKSVPIAANGRPKESTFVCAITLLDAEQADWDESWARQKLSRVLFVPVAGDSGGVRTIGRVVLWEPTPAQEAGLRDDFEEIMGTIGVGGIEAVTGHLGRWMQVRPKAASGRSRTTAFGPEGERIETVPRGFYLRPSFTEAILADPNATPP